MNENRKLMIIVGGLMVVIAIVLSDFIAIIAFGNPSSNINYIIRLFLFTAILFYAAYLKHETFFARHKLSLLQHACRQIKCGIAIFKHNEFVEYLSCKEIFDLFGLQGNKIDVTKAQPQRNVMRFEEYEKSDCCKCYVDRLIVPLTDFNGGGYTAELLIDVSEREMKRMRREKEYFEMFKILVNIFELEDSYNQGHSEVVSNLSQEVAKALGLPDDEMLTIRNAALFHDIGKIIIPAAIINKTEKLAETEVDIIRLHPEAGAVVLTGIGLFQKEALIVRHHHERFDDKGYPAGLTGQDIPLGSRIIAIADAFEAITAGRSINGRRDIDETLAILQNEKGGQFDPMLVDIFINIVNAERTAERIESDEY